MKKILVILLLNLPVIVYLLLPFPSRPNLINATASPEPGDNGQISNMKAFFTNQYRAQVMPFYYTNIARPYILINHPPERAKEVFRDTTQSYYLEEFVIPLKGSIYVNGYEWENDVFTKPGRREVNKMLIGKDVYKSKVSIRWFISPLYLRLLNLLFINLALISFFKGINKAFYDKK
jgi:hypothetical protein